MMNSKAHCHIPWIRDEVILALSVIIDNPNVNFNTKDACCYELSKLLNDLPVIDSSKRPSDFRNVNGMSFQLGKFSRVVRGFQTPEHIGNLWHKVWMEFSKHTDNLLCIANAIKSNINFAKKIDKSNFNLNSSWPEGIMLEGIHKFVESSCNYAKDESCVVCNMYPDVVYKLELCTKEFLELHCLRSPLAMNGRIPKELYITVCPSCHKMLHLHRPWADSLKDISIIRWKK